MLGGRRAGRIGSLVLVIPEQELETIGRVKRKDVWEFKKKKKEKKKKT